MCVIMAVTTGAPLTLVLHRATVVQVRELLERSFKAADGTSLLRRSGVAGLPAVKHDVYLVRSHFPFSFCGHR
jgi:hypothetical protein